MSSSSKKHDSGRWFTLAGCDFEESGGRYTASATGGPSSAARKAASKLYNAHKKKTFNIIMRETTQNSAKKSYSYTVNVVELAEPRQIHVDVDGNPVFVHTEVKVKSCKSDYE